MKKIFTLILLAAVCLAGCQNEEENAATTTSGYPILISPVITRATGTSFEEGDRIGITISNTAGVYATNQAMTFSGDVFSGNLYWPSDDTSTWDLVAYYPYNSTAAPTSFTVQADQTTGYDASDLIAASKSGVAPTANEIIMEFRHLLAKLLINIDNQSGSEITSIVVQGTKPAATVDLEALAVAVDETSAATDITAQAVNSSTYRAIVIPQTAEMTLVVTLANGITLSKALAFTALVQAGQYNIDLKILSDDITVTISGEIENWTDEGNISIDENGGNEEEVPFEEHLDENYFVYDGERYATVELSNGSIWMAEPLRYIPSGYTPSADPTKDAHIWYPYKLTDVTTANNAGGAEALTDEESVEKYGYLYDFYVALDADIDEDNCYDFEGVQGICPKGWHIATRADFFDLCGLSNKNALGESGNQINTDALFYDAGYTGGKWTLYNEAGWNYVLTGARMMNNFNSTPTYQLTAMSSNYATEEIATANADRCRLTYIMSSTCYQPNYSSTTGELSNIQFFSQMTTFNLSSYPEGRINVAYIGIKSGLQVRCVRDSE